MLHKRYLLFPRVWDYFVIGLGGCNWNLACPNWICSWRGCDRMWEREGRFKQKYFRKHSTHDRLTFHVVLRHCLFDKWSPVTLSLHFSTVDIFFRNYRHQNKNWVKISWQFMICIKTIDKYYNFVDSTFFGNSIPSRRSEEWKSFRAHKFLCCDALLKEFIYYVTLVNKKNISKVYYFQRYFNKLLRAPIQRLFYFSLLYSYSIFSFTYQIKSEILSSRDRQKQTRYDVFQYFFLSF